MLNEGRWPGVNGSIVPADYIKAMTTPQTKFAPYKKYTNPMYGLLTWLNPHLNETAAYPGMSKIPKNDPLPPEDNMPAGLDKNMYFLGGALGQIVLVVPQDNLVAVSMGFSQSDLSGLRVCVQMANSMCPVLQGCTRNATTDSATESVIV
jgi:hypothetical protein